MTTVVLFLITQHALAQFTDNFDDGDFTSGPSWAGSTGEFMVNTSGQLQLNSAAASSVFLSCPFTASTIDGYEWQVYVRQAFSGSANNFGKIYIVSDQPDLSGPLNGYYLQFGEAGSNDAIELFRQTGTQSVSVCRATNGTIASAFALRVKLTRDQGGLWKLYADYDGGTNFLLETSGHDDTYTSSNFLGVRCAFTASNATKFYFDDFYMGPSIVDTKPPEIVDVIATSYSKIEIRFDEPIDPVSVSDVSLYTIAPDFHPTTSSLKADQKTITLLFNPAIEKNPDFHFTIFVSGVTDLAGNVMTSVSKDLILFDPVPSMFKDIVVTEVFADPEPPVGLPPHEFLELYNRTSNPFDLSGWSIGDDKSSGKIPPLILLPGNFVIVTAAASVSDFPEQNVIGVNNFPSLNNVGDVLILKNQHGEKIDSIQYSDKWYRDDEKADGGWSLELIDPQNVCATWQNWTASEDDSGGTPGKANSVAAENPDLTGPLLLFATPVSSHALMLKFNEALSSELPAPGNFSFLPGLTVSGVSFGDESLTTIIISLNEAIQSRTTYNVSVKDLYDCSGNMIQPNHSTAIFGLPEKANSLDVVINELLFNPRPTGIDFVEINNISGKFIDLRNWSLANVLDDSVINVKPITTSEFLLEPGALLVLTESGNRVKGEYVQSREERFFEVAALPSFNDDAGSVALLDENNTIIDQFTYSRTMHSPYLKDDEGVSLERSNPTTAPPAWESASSLTGYATPGYVNSATLPDNFSEDRVTVTPEIFEPVTGQPSSADIHFEFEQGNYVANVKILDAQGRTIRQLSNNDLLGSHGAFRWDGTMDDGQVVRIGYYVVWFQVFHNNGAIHTYRKKVAVAGRL